MDNYSSKLSFLLQQIDPAKGHYVGVDFDGTLATYSHGQYPTLGAPIGPMVQTVRHLLEEGFDCRIFTSRVSRENEDWMEQGLRIATWTKEHIGTPLRVTCIKSVHMKLLFDDRVIRVLANLGTFAAPTPPPNPNAAAPPPLTVPEILAACARTYCERNAIYGDNYKDYGRVMAGLFPNGLALSEEQDWVRLGLILNCVTKLGRYCGTPDGHKDSAHDLTTYAAMLEEQTNEK